MSSPVDQEEQDQSPSTSSSESSEEENIEVESPPPKEEEKTDEAELQNVLADVQKHIKAEGWHMAVVPTEDDTIPPVVYTIGLFDSFKHPELIMVGLPFEEMVQIMGEISLHVKNTNGNTGWKDGTKTVEFLSDDMPIQFSTVSPEKKPEFVRLGLAFYQSKSKNPEDPTEFPLFQVLWSDQERNFPYERDCAFGVKFRQPILAKRVIENPWPFKEAPNLSCEIHKSVVQETDKHPILLVKRIENGWKFYGDPNETALKDCVILNLEEIYAMDQSILTLVDMKPDQIAKRKSESAPWEIGAA